MPSESYREYVLKLLRLREPEDRALRVKLESIARDYQERGLFHTTLYFSDAFEAYRQYQHKIAEIAQGELKRLLIADRIRLDEASKRELSASRETALRSALEERLTDLNHEMSALGLPSLTGQSIRMRIDQAVYAEAVQAVELLALEVNRAISELEPNERSSPTTATEASDMRKVVVLIASPNDVLPERDAVEGALNDWNHEHTEDLGFFFLRRRWEKDVVPAVGDRAQGVVNDQIVKKSDMLIAVFWTRLGTPTGKADSGTLEEIDEFIATGRPVQIYFCTRAIPQDADHEQYARLRNWKKTISKTAMIGEFDNPDRLRQTIKDNLLKWVRDQRNAASPKQTPSGAPVAKSPPGVPVPELIAEDRNAVVDARINPTREKGQRRQLAQIVAYNRGPGPILIDGWFGVVGDRECHASMQCVRGHLPVRLEEKSRLDITVALDFEWEELVRFGVEDAERRPHEVKKEDLKRFIAVARQHMPPP